MERGREADGEVRIRMWGGQCERGGTGGEEDGLGMRWDGIGGGGVEAEGSTGKRSGGRWSAGSGEDGRGREKEKENTQY